MVLWNENSAHINCLTANIKRSALKIKTQISTHDAKILVPVATVKEWNTENGANDATLTTNAKDVEISRTETEKTEETKKEKNSNHALKERKNSKKITNLRF